MTFHDLRAAVERLKDHPCVHPNTPVRLVVQHEADCGDGVTDRWTEDTPLCSIAVQDHAIVLSGGQNEPAIAR